VLLLPFGPLARWQREESMRFRSMLKSGAVVALAAAAATCVWLGEFALKAMAGAAGAAWLLVGSLLFIRRRRSAPVKGPRYPAEMLGMLAAHIGMAVFVAGVLLTEATSIEKDIALRPGETVELRGYRFRFDGTEPVQGPNFRADRGTVTVFDGEREIAVLHPEKRGYASGGQIMTEAAIDPALTRDLYVALGEPLGGGDGAAQAWAVRVYVKPFIRCIWLGALLMMLGSFVAACDRRFRLPRESVASEARPAPLAEAGA